MGGKINQSPAKLCILSGVQWAYILQLVYKVKHFPVSMVTDIIS